MASGREGMKAAFRLGRSLTPTQHKAPGFRLGYTSPCHATMTQLLRKLDTDAMALVFSQVIAKPVDENNADCNHITIVRGQSCFVRDAPGEALSAENGVD